uniref:NADH dehydrogenase subunit 4L n=1 Tax=Ibidoecus plataleae TaxID=3004258 RepID=A0A9E9ESA5_9NEOP|nr:NADH dehydrogenase subunit 4L [Ibidoecus plataleae]
MKSYLLFNAMVALGKLFSSQAMMHILISLETSIWSIFCSSVFVETHGMTFTVLMMCALLICEGIIGLCILAKTMKMYDQMSESKTNQF